jgi:hypothetical protein
MADPRPSDATDAYEHNVGAHTVRFVPPDTYIVRQVGTLTLDEVVAIWDAVDEFCKQKDIIFGVIEQSRAGKVPADVRRVLLGRMPQRQAATVFVNVPAMARIGISFGYKAFVMINRGREQPHAFVESEAEAHTWIAEQRKQRAANATRSSAGG